MISQIKSSPLRGSYEETIKSNLYSLKKNMSDSASAQNLNSTTTTITSFFLNNTTNLSKKNLSYENNNKEITIFLVLILVLLIICVVILFFNFKKLYKLNSITTKITDDRLRVASNFSQSRLSRISEQFVSFQTINIFNNEINLETNVSVTIDNESVNRSFTVKD
jgi:hypothetical protein